MSKDYNTITYNHGPGSFAHNNAHLLPGEPLKHDTGQSLSRETFDNARDPLIAKQKQDLRPDKPLSRESFMAKRAAPHHIMRPPMQMTMAAERSAFTQRWHREQLQARNVSKSQQQSDSRGTHFNVQLSKERKVMPSDTKTQTPQAPTEPINKPAAVERDGALKATTWKNESEHGVHFSTTFARSYQDEQGYWQESQSFSSTELLRLSELARGAYHTERELRHEHKQAQLKQRTEPVHDEEKTTNADRDSFQNQRQRRSRGTRRSRSQ